MAAPQIPNLLSMRGRGGGRGGRGRGHGGSTISAHEFANEFIPERYEAEVLRDRVIRETDTDAAVSRRAAVTAGYLDDKYAYEFTTNKTPCRRLPIINRGTYVRTVALDKIIESFIKTNKHCQIISLGAGTDTRYFRLREKNLHRGILYHEIDFPYMSYYKHQCIVASPVLSPPKTGFFALHPADTTPEKLKWGFYTNKEKRNGYVFHPINLRELPNKIEGILDIPTLLISECCLCYFEDEEADGIVEFFSKQIKDLGILIYEPTNPDTTFGKTMAANLATRGIDMPCLQVYCSIDAQMQRLLDLGFTQQRFAAHVDWLWDNWVDGAEKARINKHEMLDETEEWKLLASHYLVVWGSKRRNHQSKAFDVWNQFIAEQEAHGNDLGIEEIQAGGVDEENDDDDDEDDDDEYDEEDDEEDDDDEDTETENQGPNTPMQI